MWVQFTDGVMASKKLTGQSYREKVPLSIRCCGLRVLSEESILVLLSPPAGIEELQSPHSYMICSDQRSLTAAVFVLTKLPALV